MSLIQRSKEKGDLQYPAEDYTLVEAIQSFYSMRWPELPWNHVDLNKDESEIGMTMKANMLDVISNFPSSSKFDFLYVLIRSLLPDSDPIGDYTDLLSNSWNWYRNQQIEGKKNFTFNDDKEWPKFCERFCNRMAFVYIKMLLLSGRSPFPATVLHEVFSSRVNQVNYSFSFGHEIRKIGTRLGGKSLNNEEIEQIEDSASKLLVSCLKYVKSAPRHKVNKSGNKFIIYIPQTEKSHSGMTANLADIATFRAIEKPIEVSHLHRINRTLLGEIIEFRKPKPGIPGVKKDSTKEDNPN